MYQIYIFTYDIVMQVAALILTADVLVDTVDDGVEDEEALELWAERAIRYNNRLMEINNYIQLYIHNTNYHLPMFGRIREEMQLWFENAHCQSTRVRSIFLWQSPWYRL